MRLRGWLKDRMMRTGPTALSEIHLVNEGGQQKGCESDGEDILDVDIVSNGLGCRSTYECKDAGFRGRTTD